MPLIARGAGSGDVVDTVHPICIAPGDIATDSCSDNVFIHNYGVHRFDDTNTEHTHCPGEYPTKIKFESASPNVFVNNKGVARLDDTYTCTAKIKFVNQSNVFAN